MKIVIQCAGKKRQDAGRLTTPAGKEVIFVAHPEKCPDPAYFCRPDDRIDSDHGTWREYLRSYNQSGVNPNKLCRARELYLPQIYRALVDKYGWQSVFILSAGWGLVRSDFLIPYYDITFSNRGKPESKRKPRDQFDDFNQLEDCIAQNDETIFFFGGQDYLSLYLKLTRGLAARKVIFHSQGNGYQIEGYECIPYQGYTNWHYSCARDFMEGRIRI